MTLISRRDFVVGLAAAAMVGCRRRDVALHFGLLDAIDGTIPRLADSLGCFAKENVNVVTTLETSGAAIVQEMSSVRSALDMGLMGLPPLCAMIGQNRTRPVVIATVSGSDQTLKLVTFSGTGITGDPASLKRRSVGYTLNTVSHQYLSGLLAKGGLSLADVHGFAGPQSTLIDNLIHGDLDAAVLWDPNYQLAIHHYTERLKQHGDAKDRGLPTAFVDTSLLIVATQIVARQDVLQTKRQELVRFLRALIDAENILAKNKATAQRSIESWVNLPFGDLDQYFTTNNFHVRLELRTLRTTLRDTMTWMKLQNPQAIVPPDLNVFIDASLLQEIDASRVTES